MEITKGCKGCTAPTGLFKHRYGYECRHTQARYQNQPACKVRFIQKEGEKVFYYYGMRLRGFSPGCQPLVGFHHRMDDPTGRYHDVLVYTRELTEQELKAYELDFIQKGGKNEGYKKSTDES